MMLARATNKPRTSSVTLFFLICALLFFLTIVWYLQPWSRDSLTWSLVPGGRALDPVVLPEWLQREFPRYQVYQYREWMLDEVTNLTAHREHVATGRIPILFVHGNSGTYGVVDSMGSMMERLRFEVDSAGPCDEAQYFAPYTHCGSQALPLSFFTIDFNEEANIQSGNLLLRQGKFVAHVAAFLKKRFLQYYLPQPEERRLCRIPPAVAYRDYEHGYATHRTRSWDEPNSTDYRSCDNAPPPLTTRWKSAEDFCQQLWDEVEAVERTGLWVVGHSMGGIVAKVAVLYRLAQNRPPAAATAVEDLDKKPVRFPTIAGVITLNTPHQYPPLFVDQSMKAVYRLLHQTWGTTAASDLAEAFMASGATQNCSAVNRTSKDDRFSSLSFTLRSSALRYLASRMQRRTHELPPLLSIASGPMDEQVYFKSTEMVPATSTPAASLRSRTILTSAMVDCGGQFDHNAILWAREAAEPLARNILRLQRALTAKFVVRLWNERLQSREQQMKTTTTTTTMSMAAAFSADVLLATPGVFDTMEDLPASSSGTAEGNVRVEIQRDTLPKCLWVASTSERHDVDRRTILTCAANLPNTTTAIGGNAAAAAVGVQTYIAHGNSKIVPMLLRRNHNFRSIAQYCRERDEPTILSVGGGSGGYSCALMAVHSSERLSLGYEQMHHFPEHSVWWVQPTVLPTLVFSVVPHAMSIRTLPQFRILNASSALVDDRGFSVASHRSSREVRMQRSPAQQWFDTILLVQFPLDHIGTRPRAAAAEKKEEHSSPSASSHMGMIPPDLSLQRSWNVVLNEFRHMVDEETGPYFIHAITLSGALFAFLTLIVRDREGAVRSHQLVGCFVIISGRMMLHMTRSCDASTLGHSLSFGDALRFSMYLSTSGLGTFLVLDWIVSTVTRRIATPLAHFLPAAGGMTSPRRRCFFSAIIMFLAAAWLGSFHLLLALLPLCAWEGSLSSIALTVAIGFDAGFPFHLKNVLRGSPVGDLDLLSYGQLDAIALLTIAVVLQKLRATYPYASFAGLTTFELSLWPIVFCLIEMLATPDVFMNIDIINVTSVAMIAVSFVQLH